MTLHGDPTPIGWITFALYLLAAGACWWTSCHGSSQPPLARIWKLLAFVLLVLGLNKQLDAHTVAFGSLQTTAGRIGVSNSELRVNRMVLAALLLIPLALLILRKGAGLDAFARTAPLAVIGIFLVALYFLFRVVAMTKLDEVFKMHFDKYPGLWLLEMGGAALISIGAVRFAAAQQNHIPKSTI